MNIWRVWHLSETKTTASGPGCHRGPRTTDGFSEHLQTGNHLLFLKEKRQMALSRTPEMSHLDSSGEDSVLKISFSEKRRRRTEWTLETWIILMSHFTIWQLHQQKKRLLSPRLVGEAAVPLHHQQGPGYKLQSSQSQIRVFSMFMQLKHQVQVKIDDSCWAAYITESWIKIYISSE